MIIVYGMWGGIPKDTPGGGYKGIPNGLKQSRPGKLCVFTLYTIRCCLCQTRTSV